MQSLFQPYVFRMRIRGALPHPLYDILVARLGFFDKGADCEAAGGRHIWYNQDGRNSGCYLCRVVRAGRLWEEPQTDTENPLN